MANNPVTIADILNPKFQAAQATYENARMAIGSGYTLAAKLYKGTDVKEYAKMARDIAVELGNDLNATIKLIEEK